MSQGTHLVQQAASPRMQVPFARLTLYALALHIVFFVFFAVQGVWPLVYFNVASIATFVVLFLMALKGRITLGLSLAIFEVALHQVFAVHMIGWDSGFQYYLLAVGPLPMVLPEAPRVLRFGIPVMLLLTFAGLLLLYPGVPPPHELDPVLMMLLNYLNLIGSFLVLWVFAYFYQRGAELAEDALVVARERSDQILHNILPPKIVARLRASPGVVADAVPSATILFTDLVGFTPLSQSKSAEEVVLLLDAIVGAFDDLVVERKLEKIKTIGDAYMVAAGVPDGRPDHATAIADLALAMRERFREIAKQSGVKLEMRVGMHTGPVVAGVIGKSKFAYDLWGDTVNTAARMESHGEPGKIHVTEESAAALGEAFVLEERGTIEVKGKGAMRTFWLVGRAAQQAA
jgi:adenylate cyclase